MKKIITKSAVATKKLAENFAKKIIRLSHSRNDKNTIIIGLFGNLGAGKTVFCQGFAKGLGITKNIHSPTFIIMKKYRIPKSKIKNQKSKVQFKNKNLEQKFPTSNLQLPTSIIHLDAYRLENLKELLDLGWNELIQNPKNIILIEWADKIRKILPKNSVKIKFEHKNKNRREISFLIPLL